MAQGPQVPHIDTTGIFKLPSGSPARFSKIFDALSKGDLGPSELFVASFKKVYKTSHATPDYVWVFEAETNLWMKKDMHYLSMDIVHDTLQSLASLKTHILTRMADCVDDKKAKAAWTKALNKVESATVQATSFHPMASRTKLVFRMLIDTAFVASLDSRRDILSFQDGVLFLKTNMFATRWAARMMFDVHLSYTLSRNRDMGADQTDIKEFVHNMFENAEAESAIQALFGYYFTGETTEKAFWQFSSHSNGGKTSLIKVITKAMEAYASVQEVKVDEFGSSDRSKFQDKLADALTRRPPVRVCVVDEVRSEFVLSEELINQMTDGTSDQKLQLSRKGIKDVVAMQNNMKLVFCTNHVLRVTADATGTTARLKGVTPPHKFVALNPRLDQGERLSNPALLHRLLHNEASIAGTLAWLVEGALKYYQTPSSITCPMFEQATFTLKIRGDPYLAWLTDTFFPTNDADHRISLADLVGDYKHAGRAAGTYANAFHHIQAALATYEDIIKPIAWMEIGQEVKGYEGLRPRKLGDVSWSEQEKILQAALLAEDTD